MGKHKKQKKQLETEINLDQIVKQKTEEERIKVIQDGMNLFDMRYANSTFVKNLQEFIEISCELSYFLPELPYLHEIDDLLYPLKEKYKGRKQQIDEMKPYNKKLFDSEFFKKYIGIYSAIVHYQDNMYRSMDNNFLFICLNCPKDWISKRFISILKKFITAKAATKICVGVKLLKVLMDRDDSDIQELITNNDVMLVIFKLKNIPNDGNKSVSSFILKIVHEFLYKFENPFQFFPFEENPDSYIKKTIIQFLTNENCDYCGNCKNTEIIERMNENVFCLYHSFMSAKNEETRFEGLKLFVKLLNTRRKGDFSDSIDIEFRKIIWKFMYSLNTLGEKSKTVENQMRYIDKYCGQSIDPYYIRKNRTYKKTYADAVFNLTNPINTGCSLPDGKDYSLYKIIYDDFMMHFQLLTIFHAAFVNLNELCKSKIKADYSEIYDNNYIKKDIVFKLLLESKHGSIPWFFEKTLRTCPFIVFKPEHEYLVEDLIRFLKGESIDQFKMEVICEVFGEFREVTIEKLL